LILEAVKARPRMPMPLLLEQGAERAMTVLHSRAGKPDAHSLRNRRLPNVGKSTLFNALTRAQIAAENYPFCTIDPNVGVVPVPDPRLEKLAAIVHPERILPTTVEFVDIAGWWPAPPRARAGQQIPGAHPRGRCDRARGALLRERRHRARGRARSIRRATSR
jgi:hypothetical protein